MFIIKNRYSQVKPPQGSTVDWGHPLAKGLVGCWVMNEGGGSRIADLTNQIGGKIWFGGTFPITWSGYIGGKCLKGPSSGNSDYIDFGAESVIASKVKSGISIVSLISEYGDSTQKGIFDCDNASGGNRCWQYRVEASGEFSYIPFNAAGTPVVSTSLTKINDRKVHLVCGTWDFITSKCYVDGDLEDSDSLTGAFPSKSELVRLFGTVNATTASACFTGKIAYLLIYNRAITLNENRWLYSSPYCFLKPITHRFISTSGQVTPTETRLLRKLRIPLNSKVGIKDGVKMVWRY